MTDEIVDKVESALSDPETNISLESLTIEEQKTLETYNHLAKNGYSPDREYWQVSLNYLKVLVKAGKILDVGCGKGHIADAFSGDEYQYFGVDLSPRMIDEARKNIGIFSVANMQNLPFKSNTFDGFWATDCIYHIPRKNIVPVLSEICRVTKPHGRGYLTIKEGEGERMKPVNHGSPDEMLYTFYKQKEFCEILTQAGFKVTWNVDFRRDYRPPESPLWLIYYVTKPL